MTTTSQIAKQARRELAPRIAGPLIAPQDDGYDDARAVYNGMIDRRPALIGRCATPEDVAAAIGFARRHELLSPCEAGATTGRGWACQRRPGHRPLADEGHPGRPRGTHRPGRRRLPWGEVDRATGAHGLATPSGIISTTGVGGLTLGGGLGHLTRAFGLTIDNLLEADMVLGDGRWYARARTRTRTCSGRSAAAAATSAS